jgi:hypothetical protein
MSDKNLLENVKAGDQVVVREDQYSGAYSIKIVTKRNPKSFVVGGKVFRASKSSYDDSWIETTSSYSGKKQKLYALTAHTEALVQKSVSAKLAKEYELENERLQLESDEAEYKAWCESEEGKAFNAIQDDWVDTKIEVRTWFEYDRRTAKIWLVKPNGEDCFGGEISVYQKLDSWKADAVLERCEVNYGSCTKTSGQAERYLDAFQRAVEIAKVWDKDAGKKWNKYAKVAVEPEHSCNDVNPTTVEECEGCSGEVGVAAEA